MPRITALLHTHNDALRLGRCLETLYPCDQIVIIDYASCDGTPQVAREYGARVLSSDAWASPNTYQKLSGDAWILCLDPHESLTESLAASLYEWRSESISDLATAFSVFLREETTVGWVDNPKVQTRLVPPNWNRWERQFPASDESALALEGNLLRFVIP